MARSRAKHQWGIAVAIGWQARKNVLAA